MELKYIYIYIIFSKKKIQTQNKGTPLKKKAPKISSLVSIIGI